MTQINLLPWREKARKVRQTRFYGMLGLCAMAAIFLILLIHFYYSHKISNQTARNDYLTSMISSEQVEFNVLDKKMKEQEAVEKELHFILSLRESGYQAVQMLDELVRVVPEGITLKKMIRDGNNITVIGKANSNLEITLLMKHIATSTMFLNPVLSEITGKENTTGEERMFQLTFSMR